MGDTEFESMCFETDVVQSGSTDVTRLRNNQVIVAYPRRAVLIAEYLFSAFPFVHLRCTQQISDGSTIYALAIATTLL